MKSIVLAASILSLTALATFAQTAPVALSAAIQAQVVALVPGADLSSLTTAQYAQFVTLFMNSDNLSAGENPAGAIKAILGAQ